MGKGRGGGRGEAKEAMIGEEVVLRTEACNK